MIDFKFYLFSNIHTHKGFYYISETGGSNDYTNLILPKSVFLSSNIHLELSYSYSINLEAFTASHKNLVFPDALHSGGQGVLLRGICKSTHEIVMIWYDLWLFIDLNDDYTYICMKLAKICFLVTNKNMGLCL